MALAQDSITKTIEAYFDQLLEETTEGTILLSRKEVAARFGCVPSQINYVLRSRFAPENGFLIESQRGGHGFIKIIRLSFDDIEEKLSHITSLIGNAMSEQEVRKLLVNLQNRELITVRERLIIEVSLRHQDEHCRTLFDVSPYKRDIMRAELLKKLITSLTLQ